MSNDKKMTVENRKSSETKIIKIINDSLVVLNKGSKDGVKIGDKYYLYYLGEEDIIDSDTGHNYGKIEYVIGKGTITHVQGNMSQLESITKEVKNNKKIVRTNSPLMIMGEKEEEVYYIHEVKFPFDNPKVGYYARKC